MSAGFLLPRTFSSISCSSSSNCRMKWYFTDRWWWAAKLWRILTRWKLKQMGVSHEGWDEFVAEEQDLGADHTTWRKGGFAKQVGLQSKDWAWRKQTVQGKTCCKRVLTKERDWLLWDIFSSCEAYNNQSCSGDSSSKEFTSWTIRCKNNISSWWIGGRHLHATTRGVCNTRRYCYFLEFYLTKDRRSFNNWSWICCSFRICKRDSMTTKFLERIGQDERKWYFV